MKDGTKLTDKYEWVVIRFTNLHQLPPIMDIIGVAHSLDLAKHAAQRQAGRSLMWSDNHWDEVVGRHPFLPDRYQCIAHVPFTHKNTQLLIDLAY